MNVKEYVRVCLEEFFYESNLSYLNFSKEYQVSTSQLHNIIRSRADKVTLDKLIEISEKCDLVFKVKCYKRCVLEDMKNKEEYM